MEEARQSWACDRESMHLSELKVMNLEQAALRQKVHFSA